MCLKNKFAYFNTIIGTIHLLAKTGGSLVNKSKQPCRSRPITGQLEEAVKIIDSGLTNRSFENGKNFFAAVMCQSCHKMRGEGADIGPDLTQLGTRFSTTNMLESIITPDKTISDQYACYCECLYWRMEKPLLED